MYGVPSARPRWWRWRWRGDDLRITNGDVFVVGLGITHLHRILVRRDLRGIHLECVASERACLQVGSMRLLSCRGQLHTESESCVPMRRSPRYTTPKVLLPSQVVAECLTTPCAAADQCRSGGFRVSVFLQTSPLYSFKNHRRPPLNRLEMRSNSSSNHG